MSVGNDRKLSVGLTLLDLSAWVRRQSWLKVAYRHVPVALRNKLSGALAARVRQQTKFKRIPKRKPGVRARVQDRTITNRQGGFDETAGVNVFAYARGQFGLAESARIYARALLAEGYPVAVCNVDLGMPHGMADSSMDTYIGEDAPYDVNLIFINPDYLDQAIANIGSERLVGRYTIACWFWELEIFPREWIPALRTVDEIMVSSEFVAKAIRSVTNKPVLLIPLPVEQVEDSGLTRADFDLRGEAFVFLSTFDFNSFLTRKNPCAVVEAFCQAFANCNANVQLLIKSSNGHRHPEKLRELLNAVACDSRILFRDDVLDRSDVQALQRCADAYVSLHRAEGFGLGIAESMRLGKPVIATAWSGNMEYMTYENSCPVDYRMVPVADGEYPHNYGQCWAEPDVGHAAAYMRRLFDDREFAAKIGTQAAFDIRDKLSPRAAARHIIQRLQTLSSPVSTESIGTDVTGADTSHRERTK